MFASGPCGQTLSWLSTYESVSIIVVVVSVVTNEFAGLISPVGSQGILHICGHAVSYSCLQTCERLLRVLAAVSPHTSCQRSRRTFQHPETYNVLSKFLHGTGKRKLTCNLNVILVKTLRQCSVDFDN